VSTTPDERTPLPERKETEIRDLPDKQPSDDAASDVKGGSITPCVRVPKTKPPTIGPIDPCWRAPTLGGG
jgi:hypothetical protein